MYNFSLNSARAQTDSISVSWAPPHDQTIMVRGYTLGWGKGIPDAYTQVLDGKQRSYDIKGLGNLNLLFLIYCPKPRYFFNNSNFSVNPRFNNYIIN